MLDPIEQATNENKLMIKITELITQYHYLNDLLNYSCSSEFQAVGRAVTNCLQKNAVRIEEARRKRSGTIYLTEKGADKIKEALENPPPPNDILMRGAVRYRNKFKHHIPQ